jgi:macrolide transport system ATP-binding/permease protein
VATFIGDLRQGFRQFLRQPGFSAAAVASLALGIGLTTALFCAVNAVLLRGSPVREPHRLVEIYSGFPDYPQLTNSYPDYLSIRERADAFQAVAAHSWVRAVLTGGERPRLVTGESVSANYFEVLGMSPVMGRGFTIEEERAPLAAAVIVVSHGLWQRQFGGRPDAIGKRLELSGRSYSVVGVAPRALHGAVPGIPTDFWVPVSMIDLFEFSGVSWTSDNDPGPTRLEQRGSRWLFVKGRLAEGRTLEQARSQIEAIFASLRSEFPVTHKNVQVSVVSVASIRFHPAIDGYIRGGSVVLLTAVGLVLLIACANVANMLLARSTARERELAVRAALGAGPRRIVGQLLGESVVLAAIGGALGILIASWASRALSVFGTNAFPVPVDFDVSVDGTVLVFATIVSLLTTVLFGLAPALAASNVDLVVALKASSAADGSRAKRRISFRDVLVIGQMAFCIVLLVAGSLMTRALLAARGADIGYDPTPLSFLSFNLRMIGYDQLRATALKDRALETIAALPGVVAVSYATRLPLAPDITMDGIKIPGQHSASDHPTPVDRVAVGPNYFRTVGVPIVAGRDFTSDEIRQGLRVAVINETMARRHWPDGSAIGRRFHLGELDAPPYEIVGIARDHAVRSVGEEPRPYLHLPTSEGGLLVRTTMPAVSALPMLRQALWKLEPNIVFKDDVSAAEMAAETIAPTRIGAGLLGAFGALALLLAAVGLYGVVAYSVSLRTREVGIRMAVGADRRRIVRMVLGQGARLAAAGIVVGTLVALATSRVLASLLYGISPFDPAAYAMACGLLMAVACLANLLPALSAARVDPLRALKTE